MIKFSVINKRIDLHDVDMLTEEPVRFFVGLCLFVVFFYDNQGIPIKSVGFHKYLCIHGHQIFKFHEFRGNHSFKDTIVRKFIVKDNMNPSFY